MPSRRLQVEIIGDASSLSRALNSAGKSATGFQRSMRVASIGAAAALGAIGLAAKVGFSELTSATKVAAQTNQVLKTTGGVANVTAKQVDALATSIMRKSGIDDEAVKSTENLLLGFTKIRNEAGEGSKIFDRATQAVTDFSVRTGRDASGAAIAFGKALNDPVKGLGGLVKAGVQFSDSQKEQIKALVESGHQLEAQKVILSAVEERYGGAAEAAGKTFAGQLNIAKEEGKNFAAALVSGAIPTLTALARLLQTATAFMEQHKTATKVLIGVVGGLAVGVLAVSAAFKVASAATAAWSAALAIARAATVAWTAAQWILNAALTANPIGVVIVALAALGVGLVLAYKKSETFREIVTTAFNAVRNAAATFINFHLMVIDKFLGGLQAMAEGASHLPLVGDKFRGVADAVGGARAQIQALQASINGLRSKEITVTTHVVTIQEMITKSGGPALPNTQFSPGRAAGGSVAAGTSYIVGEHGPEMFVPKTSGGIVPNRSLGGGNVYVTLNAPNYVGSKQELIELLKREVTLDRKRGGAAFGAAV